MKNIVILGNSPAGVQAADQIRKHDDSSPITLVTFDGHYPYVREYFAPFIAGNIGIAEVLYRPKSFYTQKNIRVISDKVLTRVSLKKKKIFTEDKSQIDYDVLMITDVPQYRLNDIKGVGKAGVYGYQKLKDIERVLSVLALIDTLVVQSDSFCGLQAAEALAKRGKEVILVSSPGGFLQAHFPPDVLPRIINQFAGNGLRVMLGQTISEILGDKDVKAVRLRSGMVIGAQAVLYAESNPDLRLMTDAGLADGARIKVDTHQKTDFEGVYVADCLCSTGANDSILPLSILEEQGRIMAASVMGDTRAPLPVVSETNLKTEGLDITVLGDPRQTVDVQRSYDTESGMFTALYQQGHRLTAAVLVNAPDQKNRLLGLIQQGDKEGPAADAWRASEPEVSQI